MSETRSVISPGDTVIVKMDKNISKKSVTCSVRVLDKEAAQDGNFVGQVIEVIAFTSADPKMFNGKVLELPKTSIVGHTPASIGGVRPLITLDVSSGLVTGMYRTDGKTEPLNVRVVDHDTGADTVFMVGASLAEIVATNHDPEVAQEGLFDYQQSVENDD